MSETPAIQTIMKAMNVLDCFTSKEFSYTLGELSDKLNIPKSSAHRILYTLQQGGYLTVDSLGNYRLGMVFLQLAGAAMKSLNIRDIAHDDLQKLSDKLGESVYMCVLDGTKAVFLDEIQSNRYIIPTSRLGSSISACFSAAGRLLLSQLTYEQLCLVVAGEELKPRTEYSITTFDQLWEKLQLTARQGYAFDNQECEIGMCCLAMPIRGHAGEIIASFHINANNARLNEKTVPGFLPILKNTSAAISQKFGYFE